MENKWLRIGVFFAISAGLIWWLSSRVALTAKKNSSLGEVESEFIEKESNNPIQILGEKVESLIPGVVKERVEEIEEKIFKKSTQVVEESEMVQEVKKTIQQATEEIDDFPDKQKKEIKQELIRQVCEELLKEANDE